MTCTSPLVSFRLCYIISPSAGTFRGTGTRLQSGTAVLYSAVPLYMLLTFTHSHARTGLTALDSTCERTSDQDLERSTGAHCGGVKKPLLIRLVAGPSPSQILLHLRIYLSLSPLWYACVTAVTWARRRNPQPTLFSCM